MIARLLHCIQGAAAIVSILLVTLSLSFTRTSSSAGGCVPGEREALISFKQSFEDLSGRLSSWRGRDCCRWEGVRCDNRTGHVIELDLHGNKDYFKWITLDSETMSSSITALHHLRYLDLSFNYYSLTPIPPFLGNLSSLRYLNLSNTYFAGTVPWQLGNLSSLLHLDLSYVCCLNAKDLSWLPHLSSLKSLDMSGVDLSPARNWVRSVNKLSNLEVLSLSDCGLNNTVSDVSSSNLTHLEVLDLSNNPFNTLLQHNWFWKVTTIKELNLSDCGWSGAVPWQLGNLSSLQHLDLSYVCCLYAKDLSWLPHLSSLKSLDMSEVDLASARNWVREVNKLSNLEVLSLSDCGLNNTDSVVFRSNLTHLEVLDLSDNLFNTPLQHNWFWDVTTIKELLLSNSGWGGPIPDALGNMTSLEVLYLDSNHLTGIMSATLKNLCNLQLLDFSLNNINGDMMGRLPECSSSKLQEIDFYGANLTGHLPVWIGNLTRLTYLDISWNMLIGDVPSGIGALSGLTYLNLGLNNFSGVLSKEHFSSLVNLDYLNLSQNSLKLDFSKDWVPPFKLKEGHFGSCVLGPQFPAWLRWQAGIDNLDISNTRINDVLPHWFWVVVSNASSLDLSRNQLSGGLPEKLELPFIREMDLSRNSLAGKLPANLTAPRLLNLLLYNNNFTGAIPEYICNDFFEINLANNKLTGDSPQCSGQFFLLQMLDLKNNNLSGEFPLFLRNASRLSFLDLSNNKFFGSVPTWIVYKMPNLEVLILRSNMFHGHLPEQLTRLAALHYLDVAHNNISGSIPSSLGRLRAMTHSYSPGVNNYSTDSISTFIKDRELNYTHELTQHIVLIDLSSNGFTGSIPKKLSSLKGLRSLNLSSNQISGPIPDGIGDLKELESLDLSFNYFTGHIPLTLSDLTFLSCLNLSYNDLSGTIPSGRQLETLNNLYMYVGNSGLCGPPLLNSCSMNGTDPNVNQEHEGGQSSLYLSMITGFVMGLWTVFCAMLFIKTWRIAYFQFLDQLYDKVYVQVAICKASFLRKCGNT